ncbi:MAG: hypothetical protein Unbinned5081contig1002_57 [Prokaryotic dsDNA virus sp.]|nr:MAG: hypothetical protein Unbinned5081contig1002_57 [Prokaryotic dsDNA virus sp.]|tara:strand:+ start:16133 stop:16342 length:210 start_codon:yes stop_codon:yes gene_type:complete
MPFKSEKQRRYLYSQKPSVAKEFESKTPKGKDLPMYAKKKKETKKSLPIANKDTMNKYSGEVKKGKKKK